METIERILEEIIEAAHEAGKIMIDADRKNIGIEDKAGKANFVTKYDQMVQTFLMKRLLEILPEASFLGEEGDGKYDSSKEYIFIVDPIDGTTNFIKDYHHSCVSIGLTRNGSHYLGVVYNPYMNETFHAVKGMGAYLNGKRIHVSNEEIENGMVLFGTSPYNPELSKKTFELAYSYLNRSLDVRRSGSAALDLCYVASGRAEVFFEYILSPWDFAAGGLIVEEAGGIITTIDGSEVPVFEKTSILAKNK